MTIDAHQHFWRYNDVEFGWIGEDMSGLRRDFLPSDLLTELGRVGVGGTIAVQARQTLEETSWLLELSGRHAQIRGVVGWFPLVKEDIDDQLARYAGQTGLVGARHVLHDEPDDDYMLRDDFNRGVALLKRHDLVYDILIFARHLRRTLRFVDSHPDQRFVLDHLAKPPIRDGLLEPWARDLRRLAQRPNVCCKVSGMVTEADWSTWTEEQLRPYWRVALEAFGPERLMFGSDWPVCQVASDYDRWYRLVARWTEDLTEDERARIFGGTAREVYGILEDEESTA